MNTAGAASNSARWVRGVAWLIAVLAAWQVYESAGFDFVEHDDGINIVFNPHLGPWSRETVRWALTDVEAMRRYVPLGWLGLAEVYSISGLSPIGYHAANVGLHAVNSALVFAIVLVLLRRFAVAADDGWRVTAALLGALTWTLHPLRVETVGWASGLLYGQSGCCALLSVLAYLHAWKRGVARMRWVVIATLLYAAAVLSYPMALGLLGVFVLLDLAHRPGQSEIPVARLAAEKIVLGLPFLAVLAVTFLASHRAPHYWVRPPGLAEFGVGERVVQALSAWAYFVARPWWPAGLTPVPTSMLDAGVGRLWVIAGLVAVTTISVVLVVAWRRWRGAALLWAAYLCLLGPMLGLTERPYFPADRYQYLAGAVWAVAVAAILARMTGRARRVGAGAVGLALVGLAVAQREQLRIWRNTDTLMACIVERAGHDGVRREYGQRWLRFHAERGRWDEAAAVAAKLGLALVPPGEAAPGGVPRVAALHLNLAMDFFLRGRRREAHEHFGRALDLAPQWSEAAHNWAILQVKDGAVWEALRLYRRSLHGVGTPVPVGARQRLLLLMADAFFTAARPDLALRMAEWARREGGAETEPTLDGILRERLARYRAAAGG